jgi:hypothetical protein
MCRPMHTTQYEITVRGRLSDRPYASFGGLIANSAQSHTVLRGGLTGKDDLFRVLDDLEAMGLELLVVRRFAAYC